MSLDVILNLKRHKHMKIQFYDVSKRQVADCLGYFCLAVVV